MYDGPTPTLTRHARERCAEMGISTKVPKAIVRHADLERTGPGDSMYVKSDRHPDYLVVLDPAVFQVVTVMFADKTFVARNGTTYVKEPS